MTRWLLLPILLARTLAPAADTGVITGVVRMPDGTPAVHVRVAAMPVSADAIGPGNATMLVALSETDDFGVYRLEEVPAGRYHVVAGRVDSPTFYPGVADMAGAAVVTVTAGNEVSGIDFTISKESTQKNNSPFANNSFRSLLPFSLNQAPPIQVAGRITLDPASQGAPTPDRLTLNVRIMLSPASGQPNVRVNTTTTLRVTVAPDGKFTLPLQAGVSSISGVGLPTGYTLKSMSSGSTDLLINSFNVQPGTPEIVIVVNADLRPRYRVDGRLTGATPGRSFFAEPIELVSDSGAVVRILIEPEGRFAFTNLLPGNYVLRFTSSNGKTEQQVTVVDHNVSVDLIVSPDLPTRFRVDGRLTSATPGRSFFAEPIELASDSGAVVRILIEPGGRFAFTNLLPGNYVLRFASSNGKTEQQVTVVDHNVSVELVVSP